ncbi:putative electron transfer flavo protein alpha chain precursor [Basidiobolus meristosporus CBS 931.73]|uniref:Probable electron transfer flavoprotein subunit alpha n=1 Tax=Basidiobolus meristosporus CBS 931.73 TaxID=1314790 RepID=A0A1Y1YJT0_9FUNG|nr:putative electron transfer flavo protein alpha chain precursor [Basidiobolus meristosporus CBS 931.73]|eukprot:ORX98281.1 putative electron transfer flavo protein alpha chain precursor [Basidiobolus meristosporus CBS 931.73]
MFATRRLFVAPQFKPILNSSFRNAPALFTRGYASASDVSTLLLVEHKDNAVAPSTLSALSAAAKLGGNVTALVAGENPEEVANIVSKLENVSKVLVAKDKLYEHGLPETYAPLLAATQKSLGFTHLVAGHSAFGKNIFPRVAALLDVAQVSDITAVESADTFVRPIYAGNAIAKVKSNDAIKIITVRGTSFPAAGSQSEAAANEQAPDAEKPDTVQWIKEEISKSDRPDLSTASRVISGGRALKSSDNFKILYDLADKIDAAVGASRAAVDAGYADNSLQVGQTGKIVAPQLYIAVGISGAIQHLAGMKDSKVIVAINKDADAPIFQVADYGLVADLFTAVPELTEKLSK